MFLYETFVFSQKTIHMRHIHFLLAGFLLCICCTLQAKNRVIDQPPFIVRNTTSIEVSKVVISDTANRAPHLCQVSSQVLDTDCTRQLPDRQ